MHFFLRYFLVLMLFNTLNENKFMDLCDKIISTLYPGLFLSQQCITMQLRESPGYQYIEMRFFY